MTDTSVELFTNTLHKRMHQDMLRTLILFIYVTGSA